MGLTAADVRLQRYDGTVWEVLPTTIVNNNNNMSYTVFESQTPASLHLPSLRKKNLLLLLMLTGIRPRD
jgi:hypothetical protein